MTYYKRNHKRQLELARIYREQNREEIDRVQPLVGWMELVMRSYNKMEVGSMVEYSTLAMVSFTMGFICLMCGILIGILAGGRS